MENTETGAAPAAAVENVAPAPSTPEQPQRFEQVAESTMAEVFDRLNPQERVNRAETGQFESKSPAEEPAAPVEGQTQVEAKSEPAAPAIAHPQSLPAELRDEWAKAPPKLAEWTAKREAEAHKRITELGEAAKASEPIRAVIDRYRHSFKGVTADQGIEKLLAANDFLERNPADGIKWLANAYGVDLSGFGQQANGEQAQESGEVRALNAKIAQLERVIADTSNRVMSREQREEQSRQESLAKQVDDFAKGKEYWSDIEDDVVAQIQAVRAREPNLTPDKILEKAHNNVLKLREDISSKLNESTRKAEAEKAEAEKKRKADEARKHASMNVKSSNSASPKRGSFEDTLREVGNRLMG